ncbi:MAG TPA: hypothetical protein VNU01_12140 [Egibacteraceae bacterium]|nr:hypothetical protein [Egibacteraceae bacterium]
MTAATSETAAAAVAAVFAARLLGQWRARRRPHALAWTVSLGLFSVASLAAAIGMASGWGPVVFAVYWFTGGLIVVPFLAAGQLMLMDPRRMLIWWTLAGLFAVWALAALALASFDAGALAAADTAGSIPQGKDVFGEGQLAYGLLRFANYTAAVVVVGTAWSAVKTRRLQILLIAVGVIIAGVSFVFIREGLPVGFSASLAVGVAAMYAGFVAAGKPPKR